MLKLQRLLPRRNESLVKHTANNNSLRPFYVLGTDSIGFNQIGFSFDDELRQISCYSVKCCLFMGLLVSNMGELCSDLPAIMVFMICLHCSTVCSLTACSAVSC